MTAPTDGLCDRSTWITSGGDVNGVGPGEIHSLRILDVDGERLVISGVIGGSRPIVEQIVDSISIGK